MVPDLPSPWSAVALAAAFAAGVWTTRALQRRSRGERPTAAMPRSEPTPEGEAVVRFTPPIDLREPQARCVDAMFRTGRLATCNAVYAAARGHPTPAPLLGQRLDELLVASDARNRVALEQLVCERGDVVGAVTHGTRADGTSLFGLDNLRAEIDDGRLVAVRIAQRDITHRIAAEHALAHSENQLRDALAAARMGTWHWDIRGDVVTWSTSCYDVFGVTPGTFGGTLAAFAALVHPDDRPTVMRRIQDAVESRTENYADEFRVQVADGSERWLEGRGRLEHRGADQPFMTGTVTDVTVRKQAEIALRNSEIRFANLAAAAFECIAVTVGGRFRDVNDRFVETLGYARDALIGRSVVDLVHPDDRTMVDSRMRDGVGERYEHRALCADGRVIVVEVQARTVPLEGGEGRVTSLRDVTEQRLNEARLVRIAEGVSASVGEAFFRSLVEHLALVLGADHVFVADTTHGFPMVETLAAFADGRVVANGRYDARVGPCAETARGDLFVVADGAARRYPDEPRLQALGVEAYVGAALRDPTGALLGLLVVLFRRPLGEATALASTLRIFASRAAAELMRRNVEAERRDSETRLRATIENTPNVAVQWYDESGRVQFWNRASERMFGWAADEAIGRTLDQLIHTPDEAAAFAATLQRIATSGETVGPIECGFRRKDGSAGTCVSTLFRVPSGTGRPTFVCMDVDVTARKRAEQRHEELARHLLVAQDVERSRLASELHDSLGQTLSLIKNRAHLARAQSSAARDELDAIERLVSGALAEVRSLVHNLRPQHVEQSGLTAALQGLVDEVRASTSIRFESRLEPVDDVVRGDAATHVFRIAQEALHNLVDHSRAKNAKVTLERDVHCVRLRVEDDGVGFVRPEVAGDGLGLDSMAERARLLGGDLQLDSRPGAGTTVRLVLPHGEPAVLGGDDDATTETQELNA